MLRGSERVQIQAHAHIPAPLCDRMLTPSRQRLNEFLALAKAAYVQEQWTTITIKMIDEADESGEWREVTSKRKRALESVITEAGVKEKLKRDMVDFLQSEEWYRDRGIPWRRGILLHGTHALNVKID